MQVQWVKYDSGEWCKLETLNLAQEHFNELSGVYVIWKGVTNRKYLYVGQGDIKNRLDYHRRNWKQNRVNMSKFYVTWALVHDRYKDGIEIFLANILLPDRGTRVPEKPPIPVNLPL